MGFEWTWKECHIQLGRRQGRHVSDEIWSPRYLQIGAKQNKRIDCESTVQSKAHVAGNIIPSPSTPVSDQIPHPRCLMIPLTPGV